MKTRLLLWLLLTVAALLMFNGAAQLVSASLPPPPDEPARSTPNPSTPEVFTHTVFLPFIVRNAIEFQGPDIPFGYGWNVYWEHFDASNEPTTFGWVKFSVSEPNALQDFCGANDLPYNVLLRLNWAMAGVGIQYGVDRVFEVASGLKQLSGSDELCVQAFEIGNEPNLFGMYGGTVDPVIFAQQLCAQHDVIKDVDPDYIVVAGGLAPTGDIDDPNVAINETVFLSRMLTYIRDTRGDAGDCFDVLGYHNYGFRTGHLTDPNNGGLCPSDMCFRGIEHAWDILYGEYGVAKRIWSTEMGWLRDFNVDNCLSVNFPVFTNFTGFENTDQEQADESVAAFQYARTNWPYSGAMFVFNRDFNHRSPWQADHCYDEQGWFAVDGHPAENALENMPKP